MDVINGYTLLSELTTDNSGFSKWGFAQKGYSQYFIKEFLSPVYPLDAAASDISQTHIMRKREICDEIERKKRKIYDALANCNTGNIITISDYFRYGSRYYIVTEKVEAVPIEPYDIAIMDDKQKLLIAKVISYCVASLHKNGIVYADIKPNNILFKWTNRKVYTAKLIDFDSSFLISDVPDEDDLQGDMVYFAPESCLFVNGEDIKITEKIDIFALGVLFHQYFSGELPHFNKGEYDYVFEAVLDDCELKIGNRVPEFMKDMIKRMLSKNPEERPSAQEVFDILSAKEVKERSGKGGIYIDPRLMGGSEDETSLSGGDGYGASSAGSGLARKIPRKRDEFFADADDFL